MEELGGQQESRLYSLCCGFGLLFVCGRGEGRWGVAARVSDSDPDSVRSVDPDPDPGGHK
jgi:hypothetical protein